jgi:polysaccharide biosynthesis protein PslA
MSGLALRRDVLGKGRLRLRPDHVALLSDGILALDLLSGLGAGLLALDLWMGWEARPAAGIAAPDGALLREILLGSLAAALVMRDADLRLGRLASRRRALLRFGLRAAAAMLVLVATGLATRNLGDAGRSWVLLWPALFATAAGLNRAALLGLSRCLRTTQRRREAVAVIGAPGAADRVAAGVGAEADVVAVFTDTSAEGARAAMDQILAMGRAGLIDSVVVAVADEPAETVGEWVATVSEVPVQISVCRDPESYPLPPRETRLLGGVALAIVADRPIRQRSLLAKEAIDRLGALLLLVLLAPLLGLIALLIAIDTPGPVIFRQRRSGWGGRPFVVFKFRTMHVALPDEAQRQTSRGDPRCTRVGRVLRRTSLDELPQLWNVLRGDMSLVGPRPHADELTTDDRLAEDIVAEYAWRRRVKPGMTGWAQVNGSRGATRNAADLRRRVALDLFYIDNWSLMLDLRILLQTPLQVLIGENAF